MSTKPPIRLVARARKTLRQLTIGWLPEGRALPDRLWQRRHRWIVNFALGQAFALAAFGLIRGYAVPLVAADLAMILAPAIAARAPHASRRLRMLSATTALMLSSAVLVDFAGGMTEAHFHFFVMVGIVALYQDWSAFGLCILITVVHHAVMGSIVPRDVYGSPSEWRKPILWALIHGAFVLAVSVTHLLAWRASEDQDLADPLTQLPNRIAFNERLERMLGSSTEAVSVLFVDLDDFKRVNDRLGHLVGDHALQAAAERMRDALREPDLLARLGGDEFAVVVEGPESIAAHAAAKILAGLQAPIGVDGREAFVRASIGVAGSDTVGSRDAKALVRSADLAMYVAKTSGKNHIARYDAGVDQAVRDRDQLRADLRHAIARGELRVHYQPVISGDGNQLVGVEALARWEHPVRGMIPPIDFIPLAEESGDIRALGAWVLQTAAAQLAAWRQTIPGCVALQLAVNVSALQLDDDDFVDCVVGVLNATGLPARQLILEITESMLVRERSETTVRLNALRERGIRIAIDDFGTGYSSLSYLAEIPADIVKIDQSFVTDLHPQSGSRVLVKSIIDLARSLGLDVVAEGVERSSQAEILHDLGCPKLQGYLYARPMGRNECSAYLSANAEPVPADNIARHPSVDAAESM
ncbi:MAG: diguanylate cyclase [Actinomycetota bacterium]|nr:diguanylate cyclase [Actinomycetota bacterium]